MDVGVLISLCVPVHNRTYDLKQTLPSMIEAVEYSPPAEIVILDYNSKDDLEEYIQPYLSKVTYRKYTGRDYYHMAHARNLSVLAAGGEYVSIMSADIIPNIRFVSSVRQEIESTQPDWLYADHIGLITIKKSEFIACGGFDERFEFYGTEDRDLADRLFRRCLKIGHFENGMFTILRTRNYIKKKNYRLILSKKEMSDINWGYYLENRANKTLVANENGWGSWG